MTPALFYVMAGVFIVSEYLAGILWLRQKCVGHFKPEFWPSVKFLLLMFLPFCPLTHGTIFIDPELKTNPESAMCFSVVQVITYGIVVTMICSIFYKDIDEGLKFTKDPNRYDF